MVKVISVCQTISGPLMSVNAVKVNHTGFVDSLEVN